MRLAPGFTAQPVWAFGGQANAYCVNNKGNVVNVDPRVILPTRGKRAASRTLMKTAAAAAPTPLTQCDVYANIDSSQCLDMLPDAKRSRKALTDLSRAVTTLLCASTCTVNVDTDEVQRKLWNELIPLELAICKDITDVQSEHFQKGVAHGQWLKEGENLRNAESARGVAKLRSELFQMTLDKQSITVGLEHCLARNRELEEELERAKNPTAQFNFPLFEGPGAPLPDIETGLMGVDELDEDFAEWGESLLRELDES